MQQEVEVNLYQWVQQWVQRLEDYFGANHPSSSFYIVGTNVRVAGSTRTTLTSGSSVAHVVSELLHPPSGLLGLVGMPPRPVIQIAGCRSPTCRAALSNIGSIH